MLPILHLNGYKIAGPTVLARVPRSDLAELFPKATGIIRTSSKAMTRTRPSRPGRDHGRCVAEIRAIQKSAREHGFTNGHGGR